MSETKYISRTEVAKLIRKDLKKNFSKTKFSVRSSSYSGGGNIDVSWENGPTEDQVKQIIGVYNSAGFDGMIDYQYYINHYQLEDGSIISAGSEYSTADIEKPAGAVEINLGTGFLFTNRTTTDDIVLSCAKAAHKDFASLEQVKIPETKEDLSKSFTMNGEYFNWYQLCYRILQKIDLTDIKEIAVDPTFESGAMYEGFIGVC